MYQVYDLITNTWRSTGIEYFGDNIIGDWKYIYAIKQIEYNGYKYKVLYKFDLATETHSCVNPIIWEHTSKNLVGVSPYNGRYIYGYKPLMSNTSSIVYYITDTFTGNEFIIKPSQSIVIVGQKKVFPYRGSDYHVIQCQYASGDNRRYRYDMYTFNLFAKTVIIQIHKPGSKITLDKAAEFNGIAISANTEYTTTEAGVLALTTTDVSGTIEEPTEDIILTNDSI